MPETLIRAENCETAAAVEITDATDTAGTGTGLAKSDHQHAHGSRGGGLLHALATVSAAGFMSAADKTKLDGISGSGGGACCEPLTNGDVTSPELIFAGGDVVVA